MLKNKKIIRFGMIGVVNTLLDFGILFTLSRVFGVPVFIANIISTTTAFSFSFVMNKTYTFQSRGTNVKRELLLFIVVTLFGLWVIQNLIIWGTTPLFGLVGIYGATALLFAKLTATVASLIWNYVLYDRIVFKTHTVS